MMEGKRVFFQFEVEGMEDESLEEEKKINETMVEYAAQSKLTRRAIINVRSRVSRMRHQQWRVESNMKKDINRAEAIKGELKRYAITNCFSVLLRSVLGNFPGIEI
jgi:hypothetical protein